MDIQKIKKLNITWLGKCPKCERAEHTVTTTKGSEKYLYDEDKVECWCGQTGVIDTDGMGSAWCEWDDKPRTNLNDFNDYYREKYPEKWAVLKSNHQACTHYHDCWNVWVVASQAAKAQAVPDLIELQERIAGHQYYHDEHGHMIVDMDDVVKEISSFDGWKAQAVPEWISVEDELPPTDTMVLICWSDSPDIEPEKDFMDICTDTGCPFWANYLNDMPTHWMHLPVVAQEPTND